MVGTRGFKVCHGPLALHGQEGDLDSIMKLAHGVKLTIKASDWEKIESWVIDWAPLRPKKHPLCGVAEGLLRKVGKEIVERFALKGRTVQVQLTRSDLRGKVKPVRKKVQHLPVHKDGDVGDVILTSVLVWYTLKETGEVILDGRGSAEYGGGLDYGAGPDGAMRRSGKRGHLVIPSGSVYVFPGSVVEHSVRPVTVPGIYRWSLVVFWDLRKKVDGIPTKAALHQWWNSRTRDYSPECTTLFCDQCQTRFARKSRDLPRDLACERAPGQGTGQLKPQQKKKLFFVNCLLIFFLNSKFLDSPY
jgi:hypothetical protein